MRVAFIGDEVTAAGMRLAGVEIHDEGQARLGRVYRRLRTEKALILLTPTAAQTIGMATISADLRGIEPLVLLLPAVQDCDDPLDLMATVRAHLGIRTDIVGAD